MKARFGQEHIERSLKNARRGMPAMFLPKSDQELDEQLHADGALYQAERRANPESKD